jgi:DNA polymerase-3 subunit epsilon
VVRRRFEPELHALRELTRRPLVVVDVETTPGAPGAPQRVVSYAYCVVEDGVPSKKARYTSLVNPGIAISKRSTGVHRIIDEDVAGKKDFGFHLKRVRAVLETPSAIFVAHNAQFDVGVLRHEFQLRGEVLPDLPIIDTMYLAKTIGYSGTDLPARPSLEVLAAVTGVKLVDHHNAAADVAATAGALLKLLQYAAGAGQIVDIEELLEIHGRGTTTTTKASGYIANRKMASDDISDEHLELHQHVLDSNPNEIALAEWLHRAGECAELRCPLLAEECLAAREHSSLLFKKLHALLKLQTEPGQAGTLVGGLMRLMGPTCHPRAEVWWWRNAKDLIRNAARCRAELSCPDCRDGDPCPLDVAHEYVAMSLLQTDEGELSQNRVEELIMRRNKSSFLNRWSMSVPDLAGHVAFLCLQDAVTQNQMNVAERYLDWSVKLGLEKYEPQLALRSAQRHIGHGRLATAERVLQKVLVKADTNPSQVAVRLALMKIAVYKAEQAEEPKSKDPKYARTRRPDGRTAVNPYSVRP